MQIFVQLPAYIPNVTNRIISIDTTDSDMTVALLSKILNARIPVLQSVQYYINTVGFLRLNDNAFLENQSTYRLSIKTF